MSAWLLPDSVADVLPSEARRIEELRRKVLDRFRVYGYELVMPPMLEYTESLLGQADRSLDLQTFKLLDQSSGRMLGLRADTTPQVARIDAHILNRQGAARLCYCGPVLHTHARALHGTREPLQCGAELYGFQGIEADVEVLALAIDTLKAADIQEYRLAFSHAGLLRAMLGDTPVSKEWMGNIHRALASKDLGPVSELTSALPAEIAHSIMQLPGLYGYATGEGGVLSRAQACLPSTPEVAQVLNEIRQVILGLEQALGVPQNVFLDLSDLESFDYHSGLVFGVYCDGVPNPVLRGGRYDEVGRVYGRARPATGFSVDLKELVSLNRKPSRPKMAIRAPWSSDASLLQAVRELRQSGEVVLQALPGMQTEEEEFECDRQLVAQEGVWRVVPAQKTGEQ